MSPETKANSEIALVVLQEIKIQEYFLGETEQYFDHIIDAIDDALWNQTAFARRAMEIDHELFYKIPLQVKQDKGFIMDLIPFLPRIDFHGKQEITEDYVYNYITWKFAKDKDVMLEFIKKCLFYYKSLHISLQKNFDILYESF